MKQEQKAFFLLVFAVFIWGASFLPTQYILKSVNVYEFLFFRFLLALFVFFLIARKDILLYYKQSYKGGLIAGFAMGIAFILQTKALPLTQSANVAFLTGLEGIIAPFLCFFICKRSLSLRIIFLAFLACFGMFLFSDANLANYTKGEYLAIACAVFFALLVAFNDKYLKDNNLNAFMFFQFLACDTLCFVWGSFEAEIRFSVLADISVLLWVLISALIFTVFCFFAQNYAQKYLHPSKVALILLLEPISAGIIGTFFGETFTIIQLLGAGLILVALAFS